MARFFGRPMIASLAGSMPVVSMSMTRIKGRVSGGVAQSSPIKASEAADRSGIGVSHVTEACRPRERGRHKPSQDQNTGLFGTLDEIVAAGEHLIKGAPAAHVVAPETCRLDAAEDADEVDGAGMHVKLIQPIVVGKAPRGGSYRPQSRAERVTKS